MPTVAAFIDDLRLVFGKEAVDGCMKRGMRGEPGWFHARENGAEVGTAFETAPWLPVSSMQIEHEPINLHGRGSR